MIEITIAQAIIATLAIVISTIIIAQPFRKKVTQTHNEIILKEKELGEMVEKVFSVLADRMTARFAPIVVEYEALKAEKEARTPTRKSRAGEIRKPSTLPKNATAEEKRLFKNRMKTRAYRAKKRAELKK